MKKINTIFFLCLLCTAQYTKQLSYWGCLLINTSTETNFKCDCEKIYEDKNNPLAETTEHASHKHIQSSDYHQNENTITVSYFTLNAGLILYRDYRFNLSKGFERQLQKPPNT